MTRKTFAPVLVTLSAMIALTGCGGGGLTVGGSAVVTDSAGTTSGFQFPDGIRLDGGAGTNTGMCTISRGASGVYGVVVDLYGDAAGAGHAVRSMTIMAHSNAPQTGQITADLGGTDFDGTCRIDVTSLDEGRGNVTLATQGCVLTHATETVHTDVTLAFSGCTVL
jgi:hypothetical protein